MAMMKRSRVVGIEINPKLVGALLTEQVGDTLRMFCFYINGDTSQFDSPSGENHDSLRGLCSALNIEETCTSVILDEAVQGRVYVQTDNQCWLYTLLNTPDNTLLPLNTSIAELPWEVVWRSQGAEVLRHCPPENARPCFAVRTRINESDAARLMRNSKTFTNPVSPPVRQPRRQTHRGTEMTMLALGVATVAVIVALVVVLRPAHVAALPLPAAAKQTAEPAVPSAGNCYLLCNHQISGPYPAKTIASLAASGLLNSQTLCRAENATEWSKLADAFPSGPAKP